MYSVFNVDDFMLKTIALRFDDGTTTIFTFSSNSIGLFGWKKTQRRNGVIVQEGESYTLSLTLRGCVIDALNAISFENSEYGEKDG